MPYRQTIYTLLYALELLHSLKYQNNKIPLFSKTSKKLLAHVLTVEWDLVAFKWKKEAPSSLNKMHKSM